MLPHLPHLRLGKGSASEAGLCHTTTPYWGVGVGHGGDWWGSEVWQTSERAWQGNGYRTGQRDADHYAHAREAGGAGGSVRVRAVERVGPPVGTSRATPAGRSWAFGAASNSIATGRLERRFRSGLVRLGGDVIRPNCP